MSPREEDPDETVVVPKQDPDETVVVPTQDPDATVAVPRENLDETVVAPRGSGGATHRSAPSTETAVSGRTPEGLSTEEWSPSRSTGAPIAPPVAEPATGSASRSPRRVRHDTLDPVRRITPSPWQAESLAEPGVRPGLPVVYAPRPDISDGVPSDIDAVHRLIGPAPEEPASPGWASTASGDPALGDPVLAAAAAGAPIDRSSLPSTRARTRRRNVLTLAAYAGAIIVSVSGLVVVWRLAFG